jgi:hypothetical protein
MLIFFLTSDALIRIVDLSWPNVVGKPALFMIRKESVMEQWSTFGQQAIEVHYQSRNQQQLIDFIENVVLKDKKMKEMRAKFVNKHF